MEYEIQHQSDAKRFVLIKDGNECVLDYTLDGNQINFTHTYVPFSLRAQGLAEILVEQGLDWARDKSYGIEASCWYVKKFL